MDQKAISIYSINDITLLSNLIIAIMNIKNNECCDPHQIVSDFYDKIYGYVIKNIHDKEVAKDITQDVMGRLMSAYDNQVEINNVRAWLFKVTRNVIADRYRKKDVLDNVDSKHIPEPELNDEPNLSAEDFIIPMINLLPEKYRVPLYMSDIENIKQSEIAEKLNLSLSATKMRCQRARKKLHELFFQCCDIKYTENGSFAYCTIKSSCDILLDEEEKMNRIIN